MTEKVLPGLMVQRLFNSYAAGAGVDAIPRCIMGEQEVARHIAELFQAVLLIRFE